MLRFDLEKQVSRNIMDNLHSAIYQSDLKVAAAYLDHHDINTHLGGNHVAILNANGERVAIITEED